MKKGLRRVAIVLGALVGLLALALGILLLALRHPLPQGTAGARADALARRFQRAARVEAWERTAAVRWTFRGGRRHLWDRERQLARVEWDDVRVLVDLRRRTGVARRGGRAVAPTAARPLVEKAYAAWANDSFWLAAIFKLFDPGVRRSWAPLDDGTPALLVTYTRGGVTPGDSYLWIAGPNDLPRAWRMWTSILPVGGLELRLARWKRLATGARVPTRHAILGLSLKLTDVAAGRHLAEVAPGADPFGALVPLRR